MAQLPIPPHFDVARAGAIWQVPYLERASVAEAWAREHGIRSASEDTFTIGLVLVDCQNTFCIPDGELFVSGRSGSGAVEDTVRLCQFIYRNLGAITQISATMDTHHALQIFHPLFWVNEAGDHPAPLTEISAEDVERGVWKANPRVAADVERVQRHALHYARSLSKGGKYPLIVWPFHGMLGGVGHALVASIEEACFFHSVARWTRTAFEIKGDHPLTEAYSALGPEVRERADGAPLGEKNVRLIDHLLSYDALLIAGQAKSHCVAWTVADLLDEIQARDASLARKVYLLEDCTSPVVVPDGPDFTKPADAAFARFADAGMHVVRSTTPLSGWPGIDR